MGAFLKQAATLIAGKMAGSNNKAAFIVKSLRTGYVLTGTSIAVIWYSAWRNERVQPGEMRFPFPGVKKLERRYPPDRPEKELAHEQKKSHGAEHKEWGTSKGNTPNLSFGPGIYVYPFSNKATVGRVDQGQDFGGTGPIYAIGRCRILNVGAIGWPGGGGVLYMLLDGPRAGQVIYVYEGIKVTVRKHDIVEAGHMVGEFIPFSPTGIEIGFANAAGVPLSHGEYTEGKETKSGKEMKQFLESLKGGSNARR